ncbi:Cache domain-containing protein [Formivibrio citricus]|uniref:Cache domain-containing protein n=1 Tax=Formivibrio citricus TaxID=83765 RepID=A0A1I5BTQ0_9NEIS|nr:Cache domain-containing protein [Formivibrio citricus]
MRLKTRVWIIIIASVLGLLVMGAFGLYSMRQGMLEERKAQISQLLDFADAQLKYFHGLEKTGKLSREEAQAQAREALSAQRRGNDYFVVRSIQDNVLLVHATAARVGKVDAGGKTLDGRPVMDAYKEAIAKSGTGKGFVTLGAVRPNTPDKKLYTKLSGAATFQPWNWIVVIGFFVDDIEARFWKQASFFIVVAAALLVVLTVLVLRMRGSILNQLGGEPQEAADSMRKIANGDLGIEIKLASNDNSSLIAFLKVMQMKLKNITSTIQDNSATLNEQVRSFDDAAKSYAETKSEEQLSDLLRAVKKLSRTVEILGKSVSRFKL